MSTKRKIPEPIVTPEEAYRLSWHRTVKEGLLACNIADYFTAKLISEHKHSSKVLALGAVYNAGRIAGIRHERAMRKSIVPKQNDSALTAASALSEDESLDCLLKHTHAYFRIARRIYEGTKGFSEEQLDLLADLMIFMLDGADMQLSDKDIAIVVHERFGATGKLGPEQCEEFISECIKARDRAAAEKDAS